MQAASGSAPGLDGLFYELYKATLTLVGPHLLAALNAMLEAGELGSSLRGGVVWLIPKVMSVPTVAQLRPITLMSADYKILTKMITARLLPVLLSILRSSQLCWVQAAPFLRMQLQFCLWPSIYTRGASLGSS
jgi:hypothetical protein